MRRRSFLEALALSPLWLGLGTHAFAGQPAAAQQGKGRLIVVMLRGAIDGLNVVVPWAEESYYDYRPSIALPSPDEEEGVIDLDGFFGLAPSLRVLQSFWKAGQLGFVHACGLKNETRSHFEAQALIERGLAGARPVEGGWMNRLQAELLAQNQEVSSVAVGDVVPLILQGTHPVYSLTPSLQPTVVASNLDLLREVGALYPPDNELGKAYQEARLGRERLQDALLREGQMAANGAPPVDAFGRDAVRLGAVMRNDPGIRLGMMQVGGWDTHINQGGVHGVLSVQLGRLAEGMVALAKALGPIYEHTVIVVVSEFGRTARENGTGGTDHGHGNALWLLGGPVRGGKVWGKWPGLKADQLNEGRDLRITTDYRAVLSEILTTHMGVGRQQLARVFPGYTPAALLGLV